MNKKIRKIISLFMASSVLSGCIFGQGGHVEQETQVKPNEVTVQTTVNQLSNDFYRAVIIDGQYQLGSSASADYNSQSTGNVKAFEEGLMRISKDIFPTDQYYLQEGQIIDETTLTRWLSRESATNPEGLNPVAPEMTTQEETSQEETTTLADSQETTEETTSAPEQVQTNVQASPIYLSQLMEKNLMVETEEGFELSGVVIGLAMNSTYQYTDAQGVSHTQEISVGEIRERGKQFANIIVGRLRNIERLRSIPIVVGIFRNAPQGEIVGGTYLLDGISREGNSVTDWTENNEYRIALPIVNPNEQSDQYAYFDNFSNEILDFFPNLNGISGEALYIDGGLATLQIEIISQFYKNTEIAALSQHVTDVAQRHLPEGVNIEIVIDSTVGREAYIGRSANSTSFQSHIFY